MLCGAVIKALGVPFIWSLLLSAFAQVQYVSSFSGSFQYEIASPEETIYSVNRIPLNISIRTTNGFRFGYDNYVTKIFYCLDGKRNVTVSFTETITGQGTHHNYKALAYLNSLSDGDHNVKIYAVGKSSPFIVDSVDFAVGYSFKTSETQSDFFPTLLGIALLSIFVGFAVFLFYQRKHKH